jgi:hypothetical protein
MRKGETMELDTHGNDLEDIAQHKDCGLEMEVGENAISIRCKGGDDCRVYHSEDCVDGEVLFEIVNTE